MLSMQKDWLSFDDQLELLAGRGMCIEDECTAVQVLWVKGQNVCPESRIFTD